ncbi:ribulose-phosphate 3-epimerase [uncultured Sunxiuqinia sp.]|uniref:ribulose-phosphate 3-epimerase n=1 Tax=uncultured Sunxiuqinia sp. TaxID=1573825 RepID=UPI0019A0C78D|nr:ribulose-phosphate 3-epimerase [Sunxiuqinia sp.]|tara:strand:- start:4168 stop:4821 length:654 start_codon:yes stop_codon:yes gene_type:complete
MTTRFVAPSILSADFSKLGEDIEMINQSEADYIHCDVMDGVFVPNISFGIPVIEKVAEMATKPLDVHLMISNPDQFIVPFRKAGASILTVHYETCPHLNRTVQSIKNEGMKASVCLNPHTPVHLLDDIIVDLDMVLVMSVNPGFGGQSFIKNSYKKIRLLKEMIASKNPKCLIEVDGGVNFETGANLYDAGADVLVSGSFIFKSDDPIATIRKFKNL